ncbi:MAG TPA: hypothetical protein VNF27_06130 [Candidatus Binataceae bacterium]|nr:hypothetical protein [Candidatus Binataceae bacterium]
MAFLIDQPTPIQAWTAVSELAYSFESDEPPATLGFQISEPSSVNDPRFTQTLELCPPTQRHFNVHGAVWLSLSDVARSVRENSTVGWIAGWALAAITWSIGGFDGIAQSVAVLAALNSILLPLVDLKRREFTLTKTVGEVLQFPVYLTLVALGTFVDRAGAHGFMRLLIAGLIVIPICAGRSFRNLLVLADLQGVDTLLDRWLADLTDFINQNIRGRDR